jgi:hypothetical protein
MTKTTLIELALLLLSVSTLAVADPYSVTWTDTIAAGSTAPYIVGQSMSVTYVLDNGGTSAASQTWNAVDVVSVKFVLNNGAITTIFDPNSTNGLANTAGSFVTDATGALTSVPSAWIDNDGPSPVISSNDPQGATDLRWYVNGSNSVYGNRSNPSDWRYADATSVGNNIDPADWSNPASAAATATSVPTMSLYSLVLTTLGLLLVAVRRLRPSLKRS